MSLGEIPSDDVIHMELPFQGLVALTRHAKAVRLELFRRRLIKALAIVETVYPVRVDAALTVASAGSLPGAQSTMKVVESYQYAGHGATLRWEMTDMGMSSVIQGAVHQRIRSQNCRDI